MSQEESMPAVDQDVKEQLVKALPKLTAEQVAGLSPKLVHESYGPGEVIIRQGDPPDRFFILISGQVEVCHENLSGEIDTVEIREPGEYFGEIGLLQNRPRSATVRVSPESSAMLLAMERQDFLALISDSRATEQHVAQEMIKRLIHLADVQ